MRFNQMISRFTPARIAFILLLVASTNIALAQPTPTAAPTAAPVAAKALPFVSPLFADNMVLQRGKANTIWGWSEPGDHVQVQIEIGRASCRERAEISRVAG